MHVNINVSVTSLPYSFCFLVSTHIVPIAGSLINSMHHDTRVCSLTNARLVLPSHPHIFLLSTSQGESNSCLPNYHSELPYVRLLRPCNQALFHPAAAGFLSYATNECPVNCANNWTIHQIQAAIDRGAHLSAQHPIAAKTCRQEALARTAERGCWIIPWKSLCMNPHRQIWESPPSQLYRTNHAYTEWS